MSAVAALWHLDGAPARDGITRMASALYAHGPDGTKTWTSGAVGLASMRMRLLSEDTGDRQPIVGGGGALVLTADVRLDNRAELAEALEIDPAALPTMGDATLLMRALERWGEQAVERLCGAFAFILWDGRHNRLICARDAMGERPLCYHRTNGVLAVASLPVGLFALPEIPKSLDECSVARHLLLLPNAGDALYHGVVRLNPGHMLVCTPDDQRVSAWWTPPPVGSVRPVSEGECAEQARALFSDAVAACLRGTGSVGSHLSAGCDSGAVTAFAAEILHRKGARLTAYTSVPRDGYTALGPDGRPGNEGPGAAALAARHSNVDHVLFQPGEATPLDALDMLGMAQDAPVLNACNMVWYAGIARLARQRGQRVMLTGAMGNMTLSYDGLQRLPGLLRAGRPVAWAREAAAFARQPGQSWRMAAGLSFAPLIPRQLWKRLQSLRGRDWDIFSYSCISPAFAAEVDAEALAADVGWDTSYQPWADGHAMRLAVLARTDSGLFNAASRAGFGIDHRDPTIGRRFLEFCLGLPEEWYLTGGVTKRLLRLVAGDRLPARAFDARVRKGYQAIDWHEGLTRARPALIEEMDRLEASPLASRVLDLPRMRSLIDNWPTDGWHRRSVTSAYRLALLRGIATGRFIRRAEGGNG